MLFHVAWNCMKQHGTAWKQFHAAWNCMETVSYCMELHETAWNCMEFHTGSMKTWTFATESKKHVAHMTGHRLSEAISPTYFLFK
jgi:hypothetical protein